MTIWGNHSTTQYPDLFHAEVGGKNAYEAVGDHEWVDGTFIPTVAKRGAAIIEARGASSAASAANAAVDHIRSWALGTPDGDWVSMGIPSDGSYGVPEGIISSFPVHVRGRRVLDRPGPRHRRLQPRQDRRLAAELVEERDAVQGARPDLMTGFCPMRCGSAAVGRDDRRVSDGDAAGDAHHVVDARGGARRR